MMHGAIGAIGLTEDTRKHSMDKWAALGLRVLPGYDLCLHLARIVLSIVRTVKDD